MTRTVSKRCSNNAKECEPQLSWRRWLRAKSTIGWERRQREKLSMLVGGLHIQAIDDGRQTHLSMRRTFVLETEDNGEIQGAILVGAVGIGCRACLYHLVLVASSTGR